MGTNLPGGLRNARSGRLPPSGTASVRYGGRTLVRSLATVAIVIALAATGCGKNDEEQARESLQLGLNAHAAGNTEVAREAYQTTLEHDPLNPFALYNLGLLAQEDGDAQLAEVYYRQAITADPRFTSALYNLAIIRADAGDFQEAADFYTRITQIKPEYAPAHLNLGFALRDLGDTEGGNEELKTAIGLDPDLAARLPQRVVKQLAGEPAAEDAAA